MMPCKLGFKTTEKKEMGRQSGERYVLPENKNDCAGVCHRLQKHAIGPSEGETCNHYEIPR
jgi:hypothetical protein